MSKEKGADRAIRRLDELIIAGEQLKEGFMLESLNGTIAWTEWKNDCLNCLQMLYGEESHLLMEFKKSLSRRIPGSIKGTVALAGIMVELIGIMKSARNKIVDDAVFSFRQPILSSLFSTIIDEADFLLKSGFEDAAAVYGRVILESELRERCSRHGIAPRKKHPSINDYKNSLYEKKFLKKQEMRAVERWADIGNSAAHGRFDEYDEKAVKEMLQWIADFIEG